MEISVLPSQATGFQQSPPAESRQVPVADEATSTRVDLAPSKEDQKTQTAAETEEPKRVASVEEQAIRAAFQAQLSTNQLLSVVRDPADNMLPVAPESVV